MSQTHPQDWEALPLAEVYSLLGQIGNSLPN